VATRPNYFTVTLDDEDLGVFDDDLLMLDDSFVFENNTSMTFNQMLTGIEEADSKASRALVWWMRYKQGKTVDLLSINFRLKALHVVPVVFANPPKAGRAAKNVTTTSDTSHKSAI